MMLIVSQPLVAPVISRCEALPSTKPFIYKMVLHCVCRRTDASIIRPKVHPLCLGFGQPRLAC